MHDLAIVIPVYNEEDCVVEVIREWLAMLDRSGLTGQVRVYDDGSRDGTAQRLDTLRHEPRVRIERHGNCGHGPTILRGYREAVEDCTWVFQCDSDGEISADYFLQLWSRRDEADLITVVRRDRHQELGRRVISAVSRLVVRILFGGRVKDVNAPYRLMRSAWLAPLLPALPADTFAPNVLISGAGSLGQTRVASVPVECRPRAAGQSSIIGLRAVKAAARSLAQTVSACRAVRSAGRQYRVTGDSRAQTQ